MSSVVVLRAHRLDAPEIIQLYEKLRRDCGPERVFILYDATVNEWTEVDGIESASKVFFVTDTDCVRANSIHDQGFRGNNMTVSWMFWHPETSFALCHDWLRAKEKEGTCPSFEYVWFVEYDVRCAGSFAKAFAKCDAISADFMACGTSEGGNRFRLARNEPLWCWFPRLDGEIARRARHRDRVGAFFPMVRVSTPMVDAIQREFGKSTGFCEVYVPTLASITRGLVLVAMPECVLGEFRYTPSMSLDEWRLIEDAHREDVDPPLFYHPVK